MIIPDVFPNLPVRNLSIAQVSFNPKIKKEKMMKIRQIVISLILILSIAFFPLPGIAIEKNDSNQAKKNDIKKLMDITETGDIMGQFLNDIISSFKQIDPDIPEEFWDGFIKEFDTKEVIDLIIPIYDKYLTHDDIKAIIKFYESDVGKKYISLLPQITQEAMAVGEKWGEKIAKKVIKKLEQKGYK